MHTIPITLTGWDLEGRADELFSLADATPNLEIGLLTFSGRSTTAPLYPSRQCLNELHAIWRAGGGRIRFSLHLCHHYRSSTSWLKQVCAGDWSFRRQLPSWEMFSRVQLNFRRQLGLVRPEQLFAGLTNGLDGRQVIFQLGGFEHPLIEGAVERGINAAVLFDRSGGRGQTPSAWPRANCEYPCGFAGGLSAANVGQNLTLIRAAAQGCPAMWIDAQSSVRREWFDINAAREFLQAATPGIAQPGG